MSSDTSSSSITFINKEDDVKSRYTRMSSTTKNLLAGGVAGCIGKTITAPLSRLTVLYQVSSMLSKNRDNTIFKVSNSDGTFVALRKLVEKNGFASLWNGNLMSCVHRFPYSAMNFAVFEASNKTLGRMTGKHDSPSNRFVSGLLGGAVACVVCYPMDLIRTRLTVANSYDKEVYPGSKVFKLVKQINQHEGIVGFYRGLAISLCVTAPTLAISFSCYGFAKRQLGKIGGIFAYDDSSCSTGSRQLSLVGSLCSGCISGVISATAIYPIDVMRKRMQVIGQLSYHDASAAAVEAAGQIKEELIEEGTEQGLRRLSTSTLHQCRHILATEGVVGFYRGLAPELLKVCPMVAIMYCSYEFVQNTLDEAFPS